MRKIILTFCLALVSWGWAGQPISEIYSPGCLGLSGIKVYLYNAKDTLTKIDSTTTDINGIYGFTPRSTGHYWVKEAINSKWIRKFDYLEILADTIYIDTAKVNIGLASGKLKLNVKSPDSASVISLEGLGQANFRMYDYGEGAVKGRFGFADTNQIFSNNLNDVVFLRSEKALQLGVGSSIGLTIREVGYPLGNGYIGIGVANPQSILEIGGEDAPRISITSNNANGKRWQIVSTNNGGLQIYNQATSKYLHIDSLGRVGINNQTPNTSSALDITSTTGALLVPRMSTAQRDALTAVNGMIIYNTDAVAGGRFEFRENGAWVTK